MSYASLQLALGRRALRYTGNATAALLMACPRHTAWAGSVKECLLMNNSALVAVTLCLAAAGAQARDVYWSVGINAPLHPGVSVGTVISNAPVYRPAPVIYSEPVYYPAPVYVRPAPVVYVPQPVYRPQRVIYQPVWVHPRHKHPKWKHHQRHHRDGRDDDRDD
jgi:hypothetical protein